jgi:lipopolysaccharide/colanic/teichoic acid biosynthesis glycosyltransferase
MHRSALFTIDLCLVAIATVFALTLGQHEAIDKIVEPYFAATIVAAALVLPALGLHRGIWHLSAMVDYVRVVAAALITVFAAIVLSFIVNGFDHLDYSLPILQVILVVCALVGVRVLVRLGGAHYAISGEDLPFPPTGRAYDTVLVVGLNGITELYLRWVEKLSERVSVAGVLASGERRIGQLVHQHPILGTPERIRPVLRELEVHGVTVDRIVVTLAFDRLSSDAQATLRDLAKTSNIRLELFADRIGIGLEATDDGGAASVSTPFEGGKIAASHSDLDMLARPYWRVKRAFDVVGAIGLIVVTAPLMMFVALLAAIDVGRPVIFWQQRPGAGGRPFKLYKFRTMADAHDSQGCRIEDDERLSAIGSFLRRTHLDELPQLYNILSGEMSFVGPRPLLPVDQPKNDGTRLLVRPGLTGWAQINGGTELSIDDKTTLDIWYLRNASLWLDLKILLRTALFALRREQVIDAVASGLLRELQQSASTLLLPGEWPAGKGGREVPNNNGDPGQVSRGREGVSFPVVRSGGEKGPPVMP